MRISMSSRRPAPPLIAWMAFLYALVTASQEQKGDPNPGRGTDGQEALERAFRDHQLILDQIEQERAQRGDTLHGDLADHESLIGGLFNHHGHIAAQQQQTDFEARRFHSSGPHHTPSQYYRRVGRSGPTLPSRDFAGLLGAQSPAQSMRSRASSPAKEDFSGRELAEAVERSLQDQRDKEGHALPTQRQSSLGRGHSAFSSVNSDPNVAEAIRLSLREHPDADESHSPKASLPSSPKSADLTKLRVQLHQLWPEQKGGVEERQGGAASPRTPLRPSSPFDSQADHFFPDAPSEFGQVPVDQPRHRSPTAGGTGHHSTAGGTGYHGPDNPLAFLYAPPPADTRAPSLRGKDDEARRARSKDEPQLLSAHRHWPHIPPSPTFEDNTSNPEVDTTKAASGSNHAPDRLVLGAAGGGQKSPERQDSSDSEPDPITQAVKEIKKQYKKNKKRTDGQGTSKMTESVYLQRLYPYGLPRSKFNTGSPSLFSRPSSPMDGGSADPWTRTGTGTEIPPDTSTSMFAAQSPPSNQRSKYGIFGMSRRPPQ